MDAVIAVFLMFAVFVWLLIKAADDDDDLNPA